MTGALALHYPMRHFWSIYRTLAISGTVLHGKSPSSWVISNGILLATVLGLPLGRVVSSFRLARDVFKVSVSLHCLLWLCSIRFLPRLPSQHSGLLKVFLCYSNGLHS
ncbi:hypothetical protein AB6H00_20685 [Providencia hangzhouensis]